MALIVLPGRLVRGWAKFGASAGAPTGRFCSWMGSCCTTGGGGEGGAKKALQEDLFA